MIKDALAYLRDQLGRVYQCEVAGENYFVGGGTVVPCPLPEKTPAPAPLVLRSISGLAQLIVANIDALDLRQHVVVAHPAFVSLEGPLSRTHRERESIAEAVFHPQYERACDRPLPIQDLVAMLALHFDEAGSREQIINLLSDIRLTDTVLQKREPDRCKPAVSFSRLRQLSGVDRGNATTLF